MRDGPYDGGRHAPKEYVKGRGRASIVGDGRQQNPAVAYARLVAGRMYVWAEKRPTVCCSCAEHVHRLRNSPSPRKQATTSTNTTTADCSILLS